MDARQAVRDLRMEPGRSCAPAAPRAFSLIELIVVLAVTVILTSMLMPALNSARRQVERVISGANMRQLGMGMTMYATDSQGNLPYSALVRVPDKSQIQEMMAIYIGEQNQRRFRITPPNEIGVRGFEGIGLLYMLDYVGAPKVFYSPSHSGDHPYVRYANQFLAPDNVIYSNFHYRGHMDPFGNNRVLTLDRDPDRVFLTDGMRTRRDLNHRDGFHRLFGDGSVRWKADLEEKLYERLPVAKIVDAEHGRVTYRLLWEFIDRGGEAEDEDGDDE